MNSTVIQNAFGGVILGWNFDNRSPIYIQIADRIEAEILSGKLGLGDKIPSVRELAAIAAVNPNTMQRALQELESRLLVTVQRASGRQVTEDLATIQKAKLEKAEQIVKNFTYEIKQLGISKEETEKIIEKLW